MAENRESLALACFDTFLQQSNLLQFTGCNTFEHGAIVTSHNIKTYATLIISLTYFVNTSTSIYRFSDNLEDMTTAILAFGMMLQGCAKVYVQISDRPNMAEFAYCARDFAAIFEENARARSVLEKYIKFCNWARPIVHRIYIVLGTGLVMLCVLTYAVAGSKLLPLISVLPVLDEKTTSGYAINLAYYIIMIIFWNRIYFITEFMFINSIAIGCGQIEAIAVACEDLTAFLERQDQEIEVNNKQLNDYIRVIMLALQKHNKFMRIQDKIFGFHSYVVISSSMISDAIALFVLLQKMWMNGIVLVVLFSWQIFTLCTFGEIYMMRVERVQMRVNGTKWYLLPSRKQKTYSSIIHMLQNVVVPSAMSFFPLNFETLITCFRAMYQYLMVLMRLSK